MGGGNQGRSCFTAKLEAGGYVQSLLIDRNWNDAAIVQVQGVACKAIARFFHPNAASTVDQNPNCNLQGLLRTTHNDDLIGFATHTARGPEVGSDGFPEINCALRVAVVHGTNRQLATLTNYQPGPYVEWKLVERRLADSECSPASSQPGENAMHRR